MSASSESKNRPDDEAVDKIKTQTLPNGIIERTRLTKNQKGQTIQTVTRIQTKQFIKKIPKTAVNRCMNFHGETNNTENVTLQSKDFVFLEHPDDQIQEEDDSIRTLAGFIKNRTDAAAASSTVSSTSVPSTPIEPESPSTASSSSSSAPSKSSVLDGLFSSRPKRFGASAGTTSDAPEPETTLRVSNLQKNVTEDDLYELCQVFGKVVRVSIPRVEISPGSREKESRGYAYICFVDRASAEAAMERLDGHGYGHMILKVEWAKPPSGDRGGGGGGGKGMSSGYSHMSGYGQRLAQDTKQDVVYASNLTGNN